jgi:Uma2 family endonuclease
MSVLMAEKTESTPAAPPEPFAGLPPAHSWTLDDLPRLPDDGRRYEIVDGSLHVTPAPAYLHQFYCGWLYEALVVYRPPGVVTLPGGNVLLPGEPTRLLVPDVLAVRITDFNPAGRPLAVPAFAVALAVEVVSPSSTTHDRFTKPALYAEAGIPHFWRVEDGKDGPTVHVYALATGTEPHINHTDAGTDNRSGTDIDGGRAGYTRTHVVRPGQTTTLNVPWKVTLTPPTHSAG